MSYTRLNLKAAAFDSTVQANIGSALTINDIMNRAVRIVGNDVDLRSVKRRTTISPGLFDDVYSYPYPTDGKNNGVIDVAPRVNRRRDSDWYNTTPEEFDRRKLTSEYVLALDESDLNKRLLISLRVDDDSLSISTLDSLTSGGGTWEAFGDAEDVAADADNYVNGYGSIRFDINGDGGTTAGIQNTALDEFDFDDYVTNSRSVFVWAFITSATDITNYKLRVGSGSSAYYEMTTTTTHEGLAFSAGWNLLRFDFGSATPSGSPDATAGTFAALYMTKETGKVSEDNYRFDWLIMRGGVVHDLSYYSKYGWRSTAGVWKENSDADTDIVNADTDEIDIIAQKVRELAAKELRQWNVAKIAAEDYKVMLEGYRLAHPSEALLITTTYYYT